MVWSIKESYGAQHFIAKFNIPCPCVGCHGALAKAVQSAANRFQKSTLLLTGLPFHSRSEASAFLWDT